MKRITPRLFTSCSLCVFPVINLRIVLAPIWSVLIIAMITSVQAAESLRFNNLTEKQFFYAEDGIRLQIAADLYGQLSGALVIKTEADIGKAALTTWLNSLLPASERVVTPLYLSPRFNYFLVEGIVDISTELIEVLERKTGILLVQPDLLLTKSKAEMAAKEGSEQPELHTPDQAIQTNAVGYGKGVKIAIIDDGFNLQHPQFDGLDVRLAYDVERRTLDASPVSAQDDHGTLVAGLIFAKRDGIPPEGIAPAASLIAIRQTTQWTSHTLLGLYIAALAGADIINCSWTSAVLFEPVLDVVRDLAKYGRGGKGMAVVFSAGNEGRIIAPLGNEAGIDEALVVGSRINQTRAPFSNFGPTVDLYLPGVGLTTTAGVQGIKKVNGTSFSAALLSGHLAVALEDDPALTPTNLLHALSSLRLPGAD